MSFPLRFYFKVILAVSVPAFLLAAADRTPAGDEIRIREISSSAPIKGFRLPTFTPEGLRDMMLKAEEARIVSTERIEVTDMTLTTFAHNAFNPPESVVSSPSAVLFPATQRVEGTESVHVKRADFELTGRDWSYDHPGQKITIGADAHVILPIEIKDILK